LPGTELMKGKKKRWCVYKNPYHSHQEKEGLTLRISGGKKKGNLSPNPYHQRGRGFRPDAPLRRGKKERVSAVFFTGEKGRKRGRSQFSSYYQCRKKKLTEKSPSVPRKEDAGVQLARGNRSVFEWRYKEDDPNRILEGGPFLKPLQRRGKPNSFSEVCFSQDTRVEKRKLRQIVRRRGKRGGKRTNNHHAAEGRRRKGKGGEEVM